MTIRRDPNGQPMTIGFNGSEHFYLYNAQGDVVAIANYSGQVVVEYTYDAWGNPLSCTGSLADTLGKKNPFRYRGYVYDEETGLYYLKSRYYDPRVGRFICADNTGLILTGNIRGCSLFSYCMNNPVNMLDLYGYWPSADYAQLMIPIITIINIIVKVERESRLLVVNKTAPKRKYPSSSRPSFASDNTIIANHVTQSHLTTPTITILNGGPLIGKIGCSITETLTQDKNPALFYSYGDISTSKNSPSRYGIGINAWDWLGIGGGYTTDVGIFINFQFTPKFHGELSLGLDGIGASVGFDNDNFSHDFEITGGWGLISFILFKGKIPMGGGQPAPIY